MDTSPASESERGSAPGSKARKAEVLAYANAMAAERDRWIDNNRAYYDDDFRYMKFLVPKGMRVLDLGCGTGQLLAALEPSIGVGVDLSPNMVAQAKTNFPNLDFRTGDLEDPAFIETLEGPFDYIVLSDTIGMLDDIETALRQLHRLCSADTRLVIAYHSHLWEPLLKFGEMSGLK